MAGENTVKFKGKTPIGNLSSRCCWCYEVTLDENIQIEIVGLDIDKNIKTYDPSGYTQCNDSVVVERTETTQSIPEGKKMISTNVENGETTLDICFISTCKESDEDTPISLHYNDEDGWHALETVSGNVPQPAIAMDQASDEKLVDLLAYYEGMKTSYLFSKASFSVRKPEVLFNPYKANIVSAPTFRDLVQIFQNKREEKRKKKKNR